MGQGSWTVAAHWIDVSVPLRNGLIPWPGDPPLRVERVNDLARGDDCTFSTLSMSAHAGTHIDAPLHFLLHGRPIDRMPLDATVGRARIIPIRSPRSIEAEELRPYRIRTGERLLFKTRNSPRCWKAREFLKDYVAVSPDAARYLAAKRVRAIGVDGFSVGHGEGMAETHRALLGAGVWIIEGLDLTRAAAGPCDLVCLPLRIVGSDGAPARAIVRPRAR
jgi:arylformamidase